MGKDGHISVLPRLGCVRTLLALGAMAGWSSSKKYLLAKLARPALRATNNTVHPPCIPLYFVDQAKFLLQPKVKFLYFNLRQGFFFNQWPKFRFWNNCFDNNFSLTVVVCIFITVSVYSADSRRQNSGNNTQHSKRAFVSLKPWCVETSLAFFSYWLQRSYLPWLSRPNRKMILP